MRFRSWHAPFEVSGFLNCGTPTKQRLLPRIVRLRILSIFGGPLTCSREAARGRSESRDVVACCLSGSLHGRERLSERQVYHSARPCVHERDAAVRWTAFHGLMPAACTTSPSSPERITPKSLRNQKGAARLVSCAAREPHADPGVHIMKRTLLLAVGFGLFASVALAQFRPRPPARHLHRIS